MQPDFDVSRRMQDRPPESGYFRIAIPGLPVLLHWSTPALGTSAGLFAVAVSGSLAPPVFIWTAVAYLVLVVVHELGHAVASWMLGVKVDGIVLAGTGGWCLIRPDEPLSPRQTLFIFAGGTLAQVVLLMATTGLLYAFGAPSHLPLNCAVIVFTGWNVILLVMNSIPGRSTDAQMVLQAVRAIRRGEA